MKLRTVVPDRLGACANTINFSMDSEVVILVDVYKKGRILLSWTKNLI